MQHTPILPKPNLDNLMEDIEKVRVKVFDAHSIMNSISHRGARESSIKQKQQMSFDRGNSSSSPNLVDISFSLENKSNTKNKSPQLENISDSASSHYVSNFDNELIQKYEKNLGENIKLNTKENNKCNEIQYIETSTFINNALSSGRILLKEFKDVEIQTNQPILLSNSKKSRFAMEKKKQTDESQDDTCKSEDDNFEIKIYNMNNSIKKEAECNRIESPSISKESPMSSKGDSKTKKKINFFINLSDKKSRITLAENTNKNDNLRNSKDSTSLKSINVSDKQDEIHPLNHDNIDAINDEIKNSLPFISNNEALSNSKLAFISNSEGSSNSIGNSKPEKFKFEQNVNIYAEIEKKASKENLHQKNFKITDNEKNLKNHHSIQHKDNDDDEWEMNKENLAVKDSNQLNTISSFENLLIDMKQKNKHSNSIMKLLKCFGAYPWENSYLAFFIYSNNEPEIDFEFDEQLQLLFKLIKVIFLIYK